MLDIHKAIPAIMAEVGHVGKDRKNDQQGYKFRGVDDVYAALQLVMAKHGVFVVPKVMSCDISQHTTPRGGNMFRVLMRIEHTFFASDGSHIEAITMGEAMDSGDKACNKAMSVAMKYALVEVFCIPTSEPKDPENDSPEVLATEPDPDWAANRSAFLAFLAKHNTSLTEVNDDRRARGLLNIECSGEAARREVARFILDAAKGGGNAAPSGNG